MFRRFPYWGWLLISLVLWCIDGYNCYQHRQALTPARQAQTVASDLQHRESAFEQFVRNHDLVRKIFQDSLSRKELDKIMDLPFFIYAYDNDTLKFWNTNAVAGTWNDTALNNDILLKNDKGVFVEECQRLTYIDNHKTLVILFPVAITYPLENDYLRSHFVASEYVPMSTMVVAAGKGRAAGYAVSMKDNRPLFYLQFSPQEQQNWVPDTLFIVLLIAALLATISWVHLMIIYMTRNSSPVLGFVITLSIIAVFRVLLYIYGLPFNLDSLTFFDPKLYASSKYLSSFGDLFIDVMCVLWLVVFIMRHTSYMNYTDVLSKRWTRYLVVVILLILLIGYVFLFTGVIQSLVHDSSISFDVSHFYSINVYTIFGLFVIGTITGISCLVIYLFNAQLNALIPNKWLKYALILAAGIVYVAVRGNANSMLAQVDSGFFWVLLVWLLLFIVLLDVKKLALVSDLFEPQMIFWALFICIFCTGILQYFNQIKEHESRIKFVEQRLNPHRDDMMEFTFDKTAKSIEQDNELKEFFKHPTAQGRKLMNQKFYSQYLSGPVNKYQSEVYFFDDTGRALFNKDTIDYNTLINEKEESASTNTPYLFYKESILERHYYLSYIPVYSDTINRKIGFVIVTLELKKQSAETVNRELLHPVSNNASAEEIQYAYAVYINDKLITQTNDDYPFTTYLRNDTLKDQQYAFETNNGKSELHYKIADKRTIIVVHNHSLILESLTLFSYLFVMLVLIAFVILMYQLYLSYFAGSIRLTRFLMFTLRKRVQLSMLGIVFISFVIIGWVTIWFFSHQYSQSNISALQSRIQSAKSSVQEYLKRENAFDTDNMFDTVSKSPRFKEFVTTLANSQKIDINVFDEEGELLNTSQEDIYNKGLIARLIRPDAFYQLNAAGKSIAIQNERVAGLSYLSAYEPLRDEQGMTLGFINVPYFSSENDLKFQISNIVVTLINLYAVIFLFSSLITVWITRWITKSFHVIIQQFGRLNLERNERITWPYDDEIGLLVKEYNKMVNKVEENAALLAQSERERAWREMARQVAHEIKNPLTPMKLNIQYLQQAMKNGSANIKELTDRVTESIVEQIDNLSYIASEFSNFATMPEAKPEELELNGLVQKAAELYLNDTEIQATVQTNEHKLYVLSDRSQILRVLTNLLSNARQAIPADRQGQIEVTLRVDHEHAIISIRDNGVGIADDIAKRIFEPYFTTKSSGTGLGLAMTKKIIEFWKGAIWFETTEHVGTTFFVSLPLLREEA